MQSCRMFLFVKQNTDINYFSLNTCENITNITWIPFLGSVLRFLSSFQCFLAIISFKPLPLFSCPIFLIQIMCVSENNMARNVLHVYIGWRYAFWVESILMLPFVISGFLMKPLQLKGANFS